MSDIEFDAVQACKAAVRWWDSISGSALAKEPAFVTLARFAVGKYDEAAEELRRPSHPGDDSPRARAERGLRS